MRDSLLLISRTDWPNLSPLSDNYVYPQPSLFFTCIQRATIGDNCSIFLDMNFCSYVPYSAHRLL